MRKRLVLLTLAAALAYFATAKVSRAECKFVCWYQDDGRICCIDESCLDFCG